MFSHGFLFSAFVSRLTEYAQKGATIIHQLGPRGPPQFFLPIRPIPFRKLSGKGGKDTERGRGTNKEEEQEEGEGEEEQEEEHEDEGVEGGELRGKGEGVEDKVTKKVEGEVGKEVDPARSFPEAFRIWCLQGLVHISADQCYASRSVQISADQCRSVPEAFRKLSGLGPPRPCALLYDLDGFPVYEWTIHFFVKITMVFFFLQLFCY